MRIRRPNLCPRPGTPRATALLAATLIACAVGTSAAPGWLSTRIRPGDTLWELAIDHGTTVGAIRSANGLSGDLIIAGGLLLLPGAGVGTVPSSSAGGTYAIHSGDTLWSISRRTGTTVAALAQANGLSGAMVIYAGRSLVIPGAGTARSSAAAPRSQALSVATIQSMIRAEAARRGVDPALALGIASVESGFRQSAVSSADAVGVMQLTAPTARWLADIMNRPLNRLNAADNIAGGVAFLHFLLNATNRNTAIASYYQGLYSVTRHGMLPDTKRYVRNVLARRAVYL